jgi:hypothetical protein
MDTANEVQNKEVKTTNKIGRSAKRTPNKENDDLEKLRKQVELLSKQLEKLSQQGNSPNEIESGTDNGNEEDIVISSDEYIKVMSMLPYTLNLTTEPRGRGKLFTFETFGQVKRILYSDLNHIIENHPKFVQNGSFIILNQRVIRRHGLDDAYESILDKGKIEQILTGNQSDAVNLFKSANKNQQEAICQMIIKEGVAGKEYDLNLLDRLSRAYQKEGYSLSDKIKEGKSFLKMLGVKEKEE